MYEPTDVSSHEWQTVSLNDESLMPAGKIGALGACWADLDSILSPLGKAHGDPSAEGAGKHHHAAAWPG